MKLTYNTQGLILFFWWLLCFNGFFSEAFFVLWCFLYFGFLYFWLFKFFVLLSLSFYFFIHYYIIGILNALVTFGILEVKIRGWAKWIPLFSSLMWESPWGPCGLPRGLVCRLSRGPCGLPGDPIAGCLKVPELYHTPFLSKIWGLGDRNFLW